MYYKSVLRTSYSLPRIVAERGATFIWNSRTASTYIVELYAMLRSKSMIFIPPH